jgi:hypothetical protein
MSYSAHFDLLTYGKGHVRRVAETRFVVRKASWTGGVRSSIGCMTSRSVSWEAPSGSAK